jgi:phytoene dehydrogenase-like protein
MKKVVIIGAGIAGLTCGIYARLNGFDTQILEMHAIPGGECTGWDRGAYHFDGCIHWLTGSSPDTALYQLWRTTGALDDTVKIVNHDVFVRYEENGRAVNLYTNADRLEAHLLEIAPQDSVEIRRLCRMIKDFSHFGMPLEKPMDMMSARDGMRFALKNIGKLRALSQLNKTPLCSYAKRFKEPLLQHALLAAIPGDYMANSLVLTLAGMHGGDGGFPMDGSRAFAKRMEQRYLSLGGSISYKSRAAHIMTDNGRAVGVALADGSEVTGDYIVSCADGYHTLYDLLNDQYTPENYQQLFSQPKKYPSPTCAIVFAGINDKIDEPMRAIDIRRNQPVHLGGQDIVTESILSYAFTDAMAPDGKTVMACYYPADYDYWHDLYSDREKYQQEKNRLKDDAIATLTRRYPQIQNKIEKTDVVTPMTYVRYCNAFRGSWMSWGGGKNVPQYFSGELPGLSGFIMAGMWTLPPGGLPGAAASGRFAAHRLCFKEGMTFQSE